MALVFACLDSTPPTADAPCQQTAWIEVNTIEPLSLADAQLIGEAALLAWVTVAAVLLLRKAV